MKRMLVFLTMSAFALACNNKSETAAASSSDSTIAANLAKDSMLDKNKATAIASLQGFSSGKVEDILKDATPDLVDYGDGSIPPTKGVDSAKAGLKAYMDAFKDLKGENFTTIAEGNHVAVFADWSGTFKNAFMGMKPTGKSFKLKDVDLFTFNDAGKITEHRSVQSFQTYLNQVGAQMKK